MLKFAIAFYSVAYIVHMCVCAPPLASPARNGGGAAISLVNGTLVENYAVLVQDVKWFFQSLNNFATVIDGILPNATAISSTSSSSSSGGNATSLSASTRLHLLRGLKHLLAGVRELSITVQQSFDAAHVRQLQHLKQVEAYVLQGVRLLKDWFANLRVLLSELMRLHNYYAPELLLGKCVTQYVTAQYPAAAYYEYPLLLFNDIATWATTRLSDDGSTASNTTAVVPTTASNEPLNIEQNEIPHHEEQEKTYRQARNGIVVAGDGNARNKTNAWQRCFRLYTTETIMRQLKFYFEEP